MAGCTGTSHYGNQPVTLSELSDKTGIPASVLKSDLLYLLASPLMCYILTDDMDLDEAFEEFSDDYPDFADDWADEEDDEVEYPSLKLYKALKENRTPSPALRLNMDELPGLSDMQQPLCCFLTPLEQTVFYSHSPLSIKYTFAYETPSTELAIHAKLKEIIQNHHYVKVSGYKESEETREIIFAPCEIYEYVDEHIFYCVGFTEDKKLIILRTDRMSSKRESLKELDEAHFLSEDEKSALLLFQRHAWNCDWPFPGTASPDLIHVKIKISLKNPNMIEKIRTELGTRLTLENTPVLLYLLQEKDSDGCETWCYEDDVLSVNSLRRWVRGYGSGMVVLEPKSLAEQIKADALKTYQMLS